MLGLIKTILETLALFMQLKVARYMYEITQDSREKQNALINKIEMLRNARDNDSNDVADVLRKQLILEKQHIEYISALCPPAPARTTGTDK